MSAGDQDAVRGGDAVRSLLGAPPDLQFPAGHLPGN